MSIPEQPNLDINRLIAKVLDDANQRRERAACGGAYDDGGCGRLQDQVAYYQMGRNGIIPPDWAQAYGSQLDPEWEEYQRLLRKFRNQT